MSDELTNRRWSLIIANAAADNLELYNSGEISAITFATYVGDEDETLKDPANIQDEALFAAWNFADAFFHGARHGDHEIDGVSILEAAGVITELIQSLRTGEPILDYRVLKYRRGR